MGGRWCAGWRGVKGGKWNNCNSIINKYIFLKLKEENCVSDGAERNIEGIWEMLERSINTLSTIPEGNFRTQGMPQL